MTRDNVTVTGFYRDNLFLQVTPTPEPEKNERLLQRISESPRAPTIVYVTLQKTAGEVAAFLQGKGIGALPYHGGMADEQREDKEAGDQCSALNVIKFLCGISSPALIKLKAKTMANYGVLQRYPFLAVYEWVIHGFLRD